MYFIVRFVRACTEAKDIFNEGGHPFTPDCGKGKKENSDKCDGLLSVSWRGRLETLWMGVATSDPVTLTRDEYHGDCCNDCVVCLVKFGSERSFVS